MDIKVDPIDGRLRLNACPDMEAFLPPGVHLPGNLAVGVRCPQSKGVLGWSVFVPAHVTVTTTLLVTSRPLPQGTVMSADDFNGQNGELTQSTLITNPSQVIGKVLRYGVAAGQALRQDMLRAPYAVTEGQTVPIVVQQDNFTVRSEGKALNNAAQGEDVQVRTSSGRVVTGTANASGEVVVQP